MSYERLELTDFVDKWDVTKVHHLEDGIVENEELIKTCQSNLNNMNWDDIGIITEGKYLGYSDSYSLPEIPVELKIGDTIKFSANIRENVEDFWGQNYFEFWTIDETYRFSGEYVIAYYSENILSFQLRPLAFAEGSSVSAALEEKYNKLNEKYIPDTIARTSDIPVVLDPVKSVNGKTGDVILDWATFGEIVEEDQLVFSADNFMPYGSFNGIENTSLSVGDKCKVILGGFSPMLAPEYIVTVDENLSFIIKETLIDNSNGFTMTYNNATNKYTFEGLGEPMPEGTISIIKLGQVEIIEIDEKYIPDTIARAPKTIFDDIEEAPTASDFNMLLQVLRDAGILASN